MYNHLEMQFTFNIVEPGALIISLRLRKSLQLYYLHINNAKRYK